MLQKLIHIRPAAWVLLAIAGIISALQAASAVLKIVPPSTMLYVVQPVLWALAAIFAYIITQGQRSRVQHVSDKAITVGSIMTIWFVVYFTTGIFTTFVHNALASNLQGLIMNIIGFGITAAAVEYVRHQTMLLAGRRDAVWFGVLTTVIFATQQLYFGNLLNLATMGDIAKVLISDIMPAIASSALLTYLALASGLPSMLTYRLGVVAMAILPPIIPKYDQTLTGLAALLLATATYLTVARAQQPDQHTRSHRHVNKAVEVTWYCTVVALFLFMTGFFAYRPTAIMSDSMNPAFYKGSMVVVQKLDDQMDISIGDIVQYEAHGVVITHRVVAIDQAEGGGRIYITKGDNNQGRDGPIERKVIRGIVRAQIPFIGYPTVWLREFISGNQSKQINN